MLGLLVGDDELAVGADMHPLDGAAVGGQPHADVIAYAPNRVSDLPAERSQLQRPVVYHMLGKLSASPTYVVSDEDMLEFICALQSEHLTPEKLFHELEHSHLLLIGSDFSNWLARFSAAMTRASAAAAWSAASARLPRSASPALPASRSASAAALAAATHAAIFKRGFAKTVIGRTFLRIFQDIIGLADRFKSGFGLVAAGVAVGMAFHRDPAIGGLQRLFVRCPLDFQQFVIIDVKIHD